METQEIRVLKTMYETACNAYLEAFCKKHDYQYDPDAWILGDPGTVACIEDIFVDMQTIIEDIDRATTKEQFIEWYEHNVLERPGKQYINYHSWLAGFRPQNNF
jgi:hypothetical protein